MQFMELGSLKAKLIRSNLRVDIGLLIITDIGMENKHEECSTGKCNVGSQRVNT